MTNALTINQEKQIRALRIPIGDIQLAIKHYQELAKQVSLYRRAQKLQTKEAAKLRKDLLIQIDACLEKLGVK